MRCHIVSKIGINMSEKPVVFISRMPTPVGSFEKMIVNYCSIQIHIPESLFIEIYLNKTGCNNVNYSHVSEQNFAVAPCDHIHEPPGFIKCQELFGWLTLIACEE